jgi:hypothetical protein
MSVTIPDERLLRRRAEPSVGAIPPAAGRRRGCFHARGHRAGPAGRHLLVGRDDVARHGGHAHLGVELVDHRRRYRAFRRGHPRGGAVKPGAPAPATVGAGTHRRMGGAGLELGPDRVSRIFPPTSSKMTNWRALREEGSRSLARAWPPGTDPLCPRRERVTALRKTRAGPELATRVLFDVHNIATNHGHNLLDGHPWPPTRSRRLGRNALSKASIPGSASFFRPDVTSTAITRRPARST